jgi:hypothetical protein
VWKYVLVLARCSIAHANWVLLGGSSRFLPDFDLLDRNMRPLCPTTGLDIGQPA